MVNFLCIKWQSRPSLSSSARESDNVAFLPRFVQASTRTWELNRSGASERFQISTPHRPTSVPSMTLHTSFGRRGISTLLRASAFVRFIPRLRFSTFPRRGRRTTPRSCEHKASPQTKGQPGIFPDFARVRRRLGLRPSPLALPTARELYQQWFGSLLS
jgi:hypothetical protein